MPLTSDRSPMQALAEQLEEEHRRLVTKAAQAERQSQRAISFADEMTGLPILQAKARLQSIIERVTVFSRGDSVEISLR